MILDQMNKMAKVDEESAFGSEVPDVNLGAEVGDYANGA